MIFRSFLLLALLFGATRVQAAFDPPTRRPPYRINGVALSSRDGAPIPFCRLRVVVADDTNQAPEARPARYPGFPQSQAGRFDGFRSRRGDAGSNLEGAVLADAHGRFSIDVAKAGAWRLTGIARGYRLQGYEAHEGVFSSAIVLTDAAPTASVRFQMAPDAIVSGVVFDEAGEPVASAQVVALQAGVADAPPAGVAQTDDRGFYEIPSLAPGSYRLRVDARPWYAISGGPAGRNLSAVLVSDSGPAQPPSSLDRSLDPSLDLVYPSTWFPGSESELTGEILTLSGGENRQADFHLLAQPAARLSVPRPTAAGAREQTRGNNVPLVVRVSGDAGAGPAQTIAATADSWEFGGLAPGTYEVRLPGSSGIAGDIRQFTVTAGGAIDLSSAQTLVRVQLHFEGDAGDRPQVTLTDLSTGMRYPPGGGRPDLRRVFGRPGESGESNLSVPPGNYRVTLAASGDFYLAGIAAIGAQTSGETVQITDGSPVLTLRMAAGRAQLSGMAHRAAAPSAGAMVLLVPAVAEADGLADHIARTETNSDGSFTLASIVPGPYILVAIENGWSINWRDERTLAQYLIHGVPVDLKPAAGHKLEIEAVLP